MTASLLALSVLTGLTYGQTNNDCASDDGWFNREWVVENNDQLCLQPECPGIGNSILCHDQSTNSLTINSYNPSLDTLTSPGTLEVNLSWTLGIDAAWLVFRIKSPDRDESSRIVTHTIFNVPVNSSGTQTVVLHIGAGLAHHSDYDLQILVTLNSSYRFRHRILSDTETNLTIAPVTMSPTTTPTPTPTSLPTARPTTSPVTLSPTTMPTPPTVSPVLSTTASPVTIDLFVAESNDEESGGSTITVIAVVLVVLAVIVAAVAVIFVRKRRAAQKDSPTSVTNDGVYAPSYLQPGEHISNSRPSSPDNQYASVNYQYAQVGKPSTPPESPMYASPPNRSTVVPTPKENQVDEDPVPYRIPQDADTYLGGVVSQAAAVGLDFVEPNSTYGVGIIPDHGYATLRRPPDSSSNELRQESTPSPPFYSVPPPAGSSRPGSPDDDSLPGSFHAEPPPIVQQPSPGQVVYNPNPQDADDTSGIDPTYEQALPVSTSEAPYSQPIH